MRTASFSSPFFIVESIQAAFKIKGNQQYPCSDIPFAYTTNQGVLMKFGSTVSDDNKESFKKQNDVTYLGDAGSLII